MNWVSHAKTKLTCTCSIVSRAVVDHNWHFDLVSTCKSIYTEEIVTKLCCACPLLRTTMKGMPVITEAMPAKYFGTKAYSQTPQCSLLLIRSNDHGIIIDALKIIQLHDTNSDFFSQQTIYTLPCHRSSCRSCYGILRILYQNILQHRVIKQCRTRTCTKTWLRITVPNESQIFRNWMISLLALNTVCT